MTTFWIVFAAVGWTLSAVFVVLVFAGAKRRRVLTDRARYWRKRAYEQPIDMVNVGRDESRLASYLANTEDLDDAERTQLDDQFLQIMNGGWPAQDSEEKP
jgi:hypothetical protein